MAALKNPKHEAFAQAVAEGDSASEAYRKAYPGKKRQTGDTNGPRLLKNAQILLRSQQLKVIQSEIIDKRFKMDRVGVVEWLLGVIKTPIGEINESHPLCQEYSVTPGMNGTAYRYKMPSKMDGMEKLIKMAGYYAPEKVEHSGDALTQLIVGLTGSKGPQANAT